MEIVFLSSSSRFSAVNYNSRKVSSDKGELMSVKNFGSLSIFRDIKTKHFKIYFKMIASLNPRVLNPQLHLCISANGKSHNKMQLTEVAERWLDKMGYGENPYLIYFHSDTSNNHVHVVSIRVDKQGKKIPSFYEKNRGLIILHNLIGLDGVAEAKEIAIRALQYGFTNVDQYRTILKSYGYFTYLKDHTIHMVRYTKRLFSINLDIIQNRMKEYQNSEIAINSLQRIFSLFLDVASGQPDHKARAWNAHLRRIQRSPLGELLKYKLNIEIFYHLDRSFKPIDYTVINHNTMRVHSGNEITNFEILTASLENPKAFIVGDEIVMHKDSGDTDLFDEKKQISNTNKELLSTDSIETRNPGR